MGFEPTCTLLEQLWRDPHARSRNCHFTRYRDDLVFRSAVKHVRSLLTFRSDLVTYRGRSEITVRGSGAAEGAQIIMHIRELRLRRTLNVSAQELAILRRDPAWKDAGIVFVERDDASGPERTA